LKKRVFGICLALVLILGFSLITAMPAMAASTPVTVDTAGRPHLQGTITADSAGVYFNIRAIGQADDGDADNPSKYYNATQFGNEYFSISAAGKFLKYNMFGGNTTPYWGTSWGDATNPLPAGVTFSQVADGDDFVYAVSMSYAALGINYGDIIAVQIAARDFNDDFVQSYGPPPTPPYSGYNGQYSSYNGLYVTDTGSFQVTLTEMVLPVPEWSSAIVFGSGLAVLAIVVYFKLRKNKNKAIA
jgi:hypothetical protein